MTAPNLDFLNPPQTPDLSFLDTPQQEPGAFQYLGNLAHNFGLTVAAQGYNSNDPVIQPLANFMFRNNPQERQQITQIRSQLEQANLKGSDAWKKVMEDFTPTNFFSKLGDSIGNMVDGNVSVGDIVTGLPKSILSTVGSPLEAATGLSLGNESAIALPPEERAAKIKETAGILVASGVGAVARGAMTAGLSKLAVAGTEGVSADVAANMIQQGGKLGLLGKQIIRNTVVGGTEAGLAGAAFGATSGANTEHQAGQIFSGLLFAPLGVVGEMIGSKVRGGDKITEIQRKAGDIFAARQLGYNPDKSLFDLMAATESIATSNSMPEAVNKLDEKTKLSLNKPDTKPSLEETVSHDGKDYILNAIIGDKAVVRDPATEVTKTILVKDIVKKPILEDNKITTNTNPREGKTFLNKLAGEGTPGINIEPNKTIGNMLNVVARDEEGKPIGLLTISPTGEKTADVFTVFTDPEYRRQGIATSLYNKAEQEGWKITSGVTGFSTEGEAFIKARKGYVPKGKLQSQGDLFIQQYIDGMYKEFVGFNINGGFDDAFDKFTKLKGIEPNEVGSLKREFLTRYNDEIRNALPIEEKALLNKPPTQVQLDEAFNNGSTKLRQSALQNNMYFDQADAGVIHLRDVDSNKSLGTFHSIQDAQEFINKSGQIEGINLDGNANIPPSASGAVLPDNLGPMQTPPVGWLERKYALWTTRLPWLTANPTLFKNWDSLFQSNLHENVFNIVDKAARLKEGKKSPWLSKLQTIDNVLGKATLADREHVFNWMETRSIGEHLSQGGVGGKPLSAMEVALGKQLVPADLGNVFRYKNAMRSVDAGDVNTISALKQQFNIGLDEEAALNLLQVAERQPLEKLSIGSSVHYARLLQNPELALTRSEYAKKFNLSQKQLQVGAGLDKYFGDLADVGGIPKDKLLFNYITHARLYENGNLDAAINKFALTKPVQEFYAALNRTGEIQSYEKDPIRAALRYTNAMFDVLYTNPAILKAQENLKVEMGKLPAGAQAKVMRDANKYLEDVMHRPAIGDKYADAAVNHLNNTVLGKGLSDYHSRKWINAVNEVFTMAAQGMRPWAGIRDFYSNTSKYFIKWGLSDTLDMLRFGADANLDNLRQSGLIEGYSNFGLNSAVDDAADALSQAGSHLKKFVDKSAQLGMKVSGQQYVNDMARAGAFLNTRNKVAELSRNLVEKKFGDDLTKPETFQKAYHSIQLERYAPPVQAAFDKLIKQNKFDEAANYLGNQHIQETFGSYANANHPSGWNNNFGRLVGKFGQWSINHRDYLVSLASRGTRSQRLQALGRLAITESSIAAVAGTLGVNLSNFYSIPGMYFKGGPAGDLFYTAYSAMFGRGAEQEAALQKVKRLLPYDGEQFRPSIIVPFSYAFGDLVDGLGMAADGDVMGGMARIGGIRPQSDTYKPSGFEETIGDTVNGR